MSFGLCPNSFVSVHCSVDLRLGRLLLDFSVPKALEERFCASLDAGSAGAMIKSTNGVHEGLIGIVERKGCCRQRSVISAQHNTPSVVGSQHQACDVVVVIT